MASPVPLAFRVAADLSTFKANMAELQSQLETTKSSMTRMTNAFDGSKVIADANAMALAIEKIGGVSNLTASEQTKVNATVTAAIEKYAALGETAPPALQQLANATQNLHAVETTQLATFERMTERIGERLLIYASFGEAIRIVKDLVVGSIDAYAQAEAAERKLTVALQTQGLAIPGLSEQYLALGRSFQETTTFSHTAIEGAEALFVQLGNVGPDMMGKALQAATDLASGLGMDLNSAVELLSKAAQGQTQTFTRYGIVLDQSRVKAEGFGYVLDAIEAKVGGQAQAEADTYSGRIKQMGNAWDDAKEAIGRWLVDDALVSAALRGLTTELNGTGMATETASSHFLDFAATLADLVVPGIAAMVAQARLGQKALDDLANPDGLKQINAVHSNAKDVNLLPQGVAAGLQVPQATLDKWQESWEKAQEAAQRAIDAIKASITGADLAKKIGQIATAVDQLGGTSKLTQPELDRLTKQVDELVKQGAQLPPSILQATHAFDEFMPKVETGIKDFKDLGVAVQLRGPIDAMQDTLRRGTTGLEAYGFAGSEAAVKVDSGFEAAVKAGEKAQKAIDEAAKKTEQDIQEMARAFDTLGSAIGGDVGAAVSSIGHMVSAVESASKSVDAAKSAFKAGDILGGLSSAASAIAGMASAAIDAGKALKSMWDHFFGTAGRDAVTQFADSMGGFDALHAKLLALGASGEQLWVNLTQGVGRNNPDQAKAAIDAITKALGDQQTALDNLGIGPDGKPTYQTLQGLQQKYNLTIEQMGPAFEQADLNSRFESVIEDMDMLSRGGVNMTSVLIGVGADGQAALSDLGKSVESVIDDAMKYGIQIPANMKPAAQALIDQGLLLDANGQKITDINQLSFGETMQDALDKLNTSIQQLIDAFGKGLPSAIDKVPRHIDIQVDAHETGLILGSDGGSVPGASTGGIVSRGRILPFPVDYFGMGGFVPRGSDTQPAMLTPGEVVLNEAQQRTLVGALAGGGNGIEVHVYIDGQEQTARVVQKVKAVAARGGLRTRAASGRSY